MAEDDSVSDGSAGGGGSGVRANLGRGFLLAALAGSGAACPPGCPASVCPASVCPASVCPASVCPASVCPANGFPASACPANGCPAPLCPGPLYRSRSLPHLLHSDSHELSGTGDKFDSGVACSNSYSGAENDDLEAAARSARACRRPA